MKEVISTFSSFIWGWPMIIMLLGTHIFLTIRLRFPQKWIFKGIKLSVTKDNNSSGEVSQFGALATALAATIGTGNIIGVATAISLGGPGAVLWCWLTGLLGISTKYAEGLLAVKYRKTDENGAVHGGPMYALSEGLGWKWMGILFAVFTAIAAFGIGNTVQANAISNLMIETFNISQWITATVLMLLGAAVILGGIKSITRVCTCLVPFMALFYVVGCLIILCINYVYVVPAIELIVKSAFNPESAGGGVVGGAVLLACRYGVARGLFSNESGLGSAPIVAAAAQTRNPVRQALVSATGTFWDTVIICAITGIVIVSSIIAYPEIDYNNGAMLTKLAFEKIPYIGAPLLTIGLLTFAFSTILGWAIYGERAIEYLKIPHAKNVYRVFYVLAIFVGALIELGIVWDFADCMNAFMAIPNLLALLSLNNVIVHETRKYLVKGSIDDYAPEDQMDPPIASVPD